MLVLLNILQESVESFFEENESLLIGLVPISHLVVHKLQLLVH